MKIAIDGARIMSMIQDENKISVLLRGDSGNESIMFRFADEEDAEIAFYNLQQNGFYDEAVTEGPNPEGPNPEDIEG